MALCDIFYPHNPKRREELIRTHQQILDCLETNFWYANRLADAVNKHCGIKLQHIEMRKDRPFKENGERFMSRLREIQATLDTIDQSLKEKLRPEDYKKLWDAVEYSGDHVRLAKLIVPVVEGLSCAIACGWLVCKCAPVLARLIPMFAGWIIMVSATAIGLVVCCGVAFIGVDAIISAIVGAREKAKLNKAIEEHKELLEQIKTPSLEFTRAVVQIEFILTFLKSNHSPE